MAFDLNPLSLLGTVTNTFGNISDYLRGEEIYRDFLEQRGEAFTRQFDAGEQSLANAHDIRDTYSPLYSALNQSTQTGANSITNRYAGQYGDLFNNTTSDYGNSLNSVNQGYTNLANSVNGNLSSALGGIGQGYNQNTSNVANSVGGLQGQVSSGYGNLTDQTVGQYGSTGDLINRGYGTRLNRAMGMIDDAGAQQARDIRQDYTSSGNTDQARLARRGLGNSTITSSLGQANQEGLQNSLGRLNESLTQQKLDTYSGLSGEALASRTGQQQGLANLQSNLGQAGLNSLQSLGTYGIDTNNAANQAALNFGANSANTQASYASNLGQAGLNAQQSGANDLANLTSTLGMSTTAGAADLAQWGLDTRRNAQNTYLGQASTLAQLPTQQYQANTDSVNAIALNWGQPPQTSHWGVPVGASWTALGQAQQAANETEDLQKKISNAGTFANQYNCIDRTSVVESSRGPIALKDVVPGDEVMSSDGHMYPVVAKNSGPVAPEEMECYVKIVAGGSELVATCDHIIDGHRADDWTVGNTIMVNGHMCLVEEADLVPYRVSGDLMLEGNHPYVANGFVVHSMIGVGGKDVFSGIIHSGDHVVANGFMTYTANPKNVWVAVEA